MLDVVGSAGKQLTILPDLEHEVQWCGVGLGLPRVLLADKDSTTWPRSDVLRTIEGRQLNLFVRGVCCACGRECG